MSKKDKIENKNVVDASNIWSVVKSKRQLKNKIYG